MDSEFYIFFLHMLDRVLIRLLPYFTCKFNINERVDLNQDGPSLLIEDPPPPPNDY